MQGRRTRQLPKRPPVLAATHRGARLDPRALLELRTGSLAGKSVSLPLALAPRTVGSLLLPECLLSKAWLIHRFRQAPRRLWVDDNRNVWVQFALRRRGIAWISRLRARRCTLRDRTTRIILAAMLVLGPSGVCGALSTRLSPLEPRLSRRRGMRKASSSRGRRS